MRLPYLARLHLLDYKRSGDEVFLKVAYRILLKEVGLPYGKKQSQKRYKAWRTAVLETEES